MVPFYCEVHIALKDAFQARKRAGAEKVRH